jgi:ATP adenylyltransferase
MDYLWTPWRYQYVTNSLKPDECIFCGAARDTEHDHERLVVYRGKHNLIMLNRYPYTSGHVMIVPHAHVATLQAFDDGTLLELVQLARVTEKHLRAVYHPEGLNLGLNLGKSAGAGIADHVHLHALPRWTGDTNFMSSICETRVLPEDLEVTWERLREAFHTNRPDTTVP